MIAVDPVDPKNIIAVAMGNLHQPEGKPVTTNGTDAFHHITKSTITWLAVTHDGGLNWDVSELPMLSGKLTRCPDSFADVLKDGTFIAGCEPRETMTSAPDFFGMSALTISRDHGKTWGPVVQLISDYQLNRFAPGLRPVSGGFPKGSRQMSDSVMDPVAGARTATKHPALEQLFRYPLMSALTERRSRRVAKSVTH